MMIAIIVSSVVVVVLLLAIVIRGAISSHERAMEVFYRHPFQLENEKLVKQLFEGDANTREEAALLLGGNQYHYFPQHAKLLCHALINDCDASVRLQSAISLLRLCRFTGGSSSAIDHVPPLLTSLATERDMRIREAVLQCLERCTKHGYYLYFSNGNPPIWWEENYIGKEVDRDINSITQLLENGNVDEMTKLSLEKSLSEMNYWAEYVRKRRDEILARGW